MTNVFVGVLLGILCYWDVKEKQVPSVLLWGGAIVGIAVTIIAKRNPMLSILPGLVLLGIGKATGEKVGYGDGILLSVLGLFFSLEEVLQLCVFAFLTSGLWALVLLVFCKKKKGYTIPFIPFILLGWAASFGI